MPELTPSTREAARRIGVTETALRKAAGGRGRQMVEGGLIGSNVCRGRQPRQHQQRHKEIRDGSKASHPTSAGHPAQCTRAGLLRVATMTA